MEAPTARDVRTTTVAVVTRLATRISNGDAPLGVIADALADLAAVLDAARVVVAVDDRSLGRQVFTSARVPLGTTPIGLFGPPGVWTDPGDRLDRTEADLVTATVGVAVGSLPHGAGLVLPQRTDAAALSGAALSGAVARARDHGWGFALAAVRFDDGDRSAARVAALQSGLRPGDLALATEGGRIAVMLPAARDDEVAAVLAASVRARNLPRCAFGLVQCPGDGADAGALLALAARRLEEAIAARYPSSRRE